MKTNNINQDLFAAPTRCPVCGEELRIVRLKCGRCGTGIDGNFTGGRLSRLTREQLGFVEAFLECRGKIKDVEEKLGISYPTVVTRLNDVVRALGFELPQETPERAEQRRQVLDELASGTIDASEAARRIKALRLEAGPAFQKGVPIRGS